MARKPPKKLRILYIESIREDINNFKKAMIKHQKQIDYYLAGSMTEVKKMLRNKPFEIILCNYQFSRSTVLDILKFVNNIPIVVLTGVSDDKLLKKALRAGVDDYMLKDDNLYYLKFLSTKIDNIVKHYQAEKEIEKLSLVASKTDNAVFISDKNGIIEWANEAFIKISGYKLNEIIGTSGEILRKGEGTGLSDVKLLSKVIEKKASMNYEVKNFTKKGKEYWTLTNIAPIFNDKGEIEKFIAIDSDITEIKKTRRELINARMKAEEASKAKQIFLANMSHEIRTPLNAVTGFTELLTRTDLSKKQLDYLDNIKISADILLSIINDVLDISKIESGKLVLEKTEFSIAELILGISKTLQYRIIENKIKFSVNIDKAIPPIVIGDSLRLNQILINLCNNAVKFTKNGRVRINVNLIETQKNIIKIKFIVSDTGIGISKERLSSIYENFTQAADETARVYGGTGLGLSIVKQLVDLQGGKINVISKTGKGSKFSVVLSYRISGKKSLLGKKGQDKLTSQVKGLNVLVAEDNEMNQLLARDLLTGWNSNIQVDIAKNGKVVLNKLKKKDYDLILMDIHMPVMDGYEATKQIRHKLKGKKSKIPIIAVTADALVDEKSRCLKLGMDEYITKPIDTRLLFKKINALIESKTSRSLPVGKKAIIKKSVGKNHSKKIFDLSLIKDMVADNDEDLIKYIDVYLKNTPKEVSRLKLLCKAKEWQTMREVTHSMRPKAAYMGIKELEKVAAELHSNVKHNKNIEKVPEQVKKIEKIFSVAKKELVAERKRLNSQ